MIVDQFSLTFFTFSWAWMLHVWFQNNRKLLVRGKYDNQFGIYQHSCVSLLEPRQSKLNYSEAYSEKPVKHLRWSVNSQK